MKAAYIIIFDSSNSIFLPDKISNIINYKETVIAYTYRLRLLDLPPSKIKMTSFLSDGLNSHYYIASIVEVHKNIIMWR